MGRHTPDLETKPFPTWMPVIREVCRRHRVAWKEVLAGYRDPRICACRREIRARLYEQFKSSYRTIGERTGGYDPSSVLAGVRKATEGANGRHH